MTGDAHSTAGIGPKDLVVIGASAGGVEALKELVRGLPPDLPAAVCIVLHIAPSSPSALAAILSRASRLPVRTAEDGAPLRPGEIVVAPPDHHLVITDGCTRLTVGPRENGHRPAVDALFRTAAESRDGHVLGVVLSGTRDDGTVGLALIKARGGSALVQDPEHAMYRDMPANALAHTAVDAVVPTHALGEAIAAIVRGENVPHLAPQDVADDDPPGGETLTSVCPECGGVLTEESEAGMTQWQCHVGHRYSPESLEVAQAARVEAALWTAVRALRDRGALLERMAAQSGAWGLGRSAVRFQRQAQRARAQAEVVLGALNDAAATSLRSPDEDEEHTAANALDTP